MKETEQNKYESCHECSYGEALQPEVLYYTVDDNDECACRTAYLDGVAAESRYEEAADYSGYEAYGGAYSGSYTESYGQRQSHYAHHDARN